MSDESKLEIVTYRKNYQTFVVTVDRESKNESALTGEQINGLIRSGHSGIVCKRDGVVVGFAFYKIQRRTAENKTRKTLWITRMSVKPVDKVEDAKVSADMLMHLKSKAIQSKISVACMVSVGSCYELGADVAMFSRSEPCTKGGVTAIRVESGRGVILEGTKNRISKYFQEGK